MSDPANPGPGKLGRAAIYIVGIFAIVFLIVFLGRNIWHGEELGEDQATGQNLTNTHDQPSYDTGRQ